MLSSADSGGGKAQKDYELLQSVQISWKGFKAVCFLGGHQFFFPLGCKTALRVSDLLFHRQKMRTITATS